MPDLFDRRRIRSQPTFHGRVSTNRADTGFQNYLNLTADNQKVHIFLDGVEQHAVTADPDTGIVEIYYGAQLVTLRGNVEIKLERVKPRQARRPVRRTTQRWPLNELPIWTSLRRRVRFRKTSFAN